MKEELLNLKDGEVFIVPESDYGKAEIWLKNNMYFLFEIPMYGGEPQYSGAYRKGQEDEIFEKIKSWT